MTNHPPWKCWHCGQVCSNDEEARLHFGERIYSDPVCTTDAAKIRHLEEQLSRYREEDTDLHRALHAKDSAHAVALRRAEEVGYARGLAENYIRYEAKFHKGIKRFLPKSVQGYVMGEWRKAHERDAEPTTKESN